MEEQAGAKAGQGADGAEQGSWIAALGSAVTVGALAVLLVIKSVVKPDKSA